MSGDLASQPWLRAGLAAFAEAVRGLGPVLDVGCGPGTVTAHLADLGLDVSGVDLSREMVEHARRRYPNLGFQVASATALDLAPASIGVAHPRDANELLVAVKIVPAACRIGSEAFVERVGGRRVKEDT